jgi:aldose 1-epimerase
MHNADGEETCPMIELRAGRLRCELQPALGGAIAGFWRDDVPLLRSTPAAQLTSAGLAACLPLVPFSNRVGHASVVWEGTLQPQVHHGGDPLTAIHGAAWQRPWTVLENDGAGAMLAHEHRADPSWPFAFDCSHTLRLTAEGLQMTLALTNQSGRPAPAGLGWRPTFQQRPGSRMAFRAAAQWEFDADRLPVRRAPATGVRGDIASLPPEACFDDWDGSVQLQDDLATLRLQSGLTRLVVGRDATGFTVAPVSHVPNAVHRYAAGASTADLGLAILQPGESLMAQLSIAVEDTA